MTTVPQRPLLDHLFSHLGAGGVGGVEDTLVDKIEVSGPPEGFDLQCGGFLRNSFPTLSNSGLQEGGGSFGGGRHGGPCGDKIVYGAT